MLLSFLLIVLQTTDDSGIVLRDVHVVDVESGELQRSRAVYLHAGRIASLAPAEGFQAPPGARVVEGGGRFLVPGLVDAHVHLYEGDDPHDLWLYLANGVTTVRSMHGEAHTLELRARVDRGELSGPRILTTGPTTAQVRVNSVALAESTVRAQKAAGYDAVKMYGDGANSMTRETYHALVTSAHALGLQVVGHAPRNMPFSVVLEERQDSIDHMEELVYTAEELASVVRPFVELQFGRQPLSARPARVPDFAHELADEIEGLARKVAAAGLVVTPTLTTFAAIQGTTSERLDALLAKPELAYVDPARRREWTPARARFRNGNWSQALPFMSTYLLRSLELQRALTQAFQSHGVPLLTGTDSPFDLVVPGFSLHDELAEFVRAGLTPLQALRAATLAPARAWKLADAGTIAPGMRADLVLVESDPRADLAALRGIVGVVVAGRWIPRATLDAELERIRTRQARRAPWVERVGQAIDDGDVDGVAQAYAEAGGDAPALAGFVEDGLNSLGYNLLRAGQLERAHAALARNTQLFPGSANAWDSLGEVLWKLDRDDEAIAAYERALELDPDAENARQSIERILEEL